MSTKASRTAANLMISPAVLLLLGWMLVPLIMTVYFSFLYYNLLSPGANPFAGWDNYYWFVTDPSFEEAIKNTLIMVGSILLVTTIGGIFFAVLLDKPMFGKGIIRIMTIAPFFVMPTVSALVWKNMFMNPVNGIFGRIATGLGFQPIDFFGQHPLASIIFIVSCATDKPTGKTEAEVLFKEAKALMDDERYILATEKLNQLKNQYPYSFYATPAELLQADILFKQENYVESAAAYLLFRDFHPKHNEIAYVVYKIAESYYQQKPDTFDRDLQGALEAIKYYNELLQKYPDSKYVKDANKKIEECERMIRDKEQYIADFYYKTEVFEAARWRYLEILKNFQNKDIRKHSMQRIVESSYLMKDYKNCINYANEYFEFLGKEGKKVASDIKKQCQEKVIR